MSRRRNNTARAGLREAAPVFAALGDEKRLRVVARLSAEGPLSIGRLTEGSGVTRQAITKHLGALARAGLVRDEWSGRERVFALETARLERARRYLLEVSDAWEGAIARLRAFVEDAV